jgi:hypothetical protein
VDRYFGVALWGTDSKQHESYRTRMDRLRAALVAANNQANRHLAGKKTGPRVQTIFVAPEYLFAQQVGPNDPTLTDGFHYPVPYANASDNRFLHALVKDRLLTELLSLSMAFDRMLLVPGTIAWRKPLLRTGPYRYKKQADGTRGTTLKTTDRLTKAYDRVVEGTRRSAAVFGSPFNQELQDPLSGDLDDAGTVVHAAPTNWQKLQELGSSAHPGTATYVGRNTAYVLHDGRVLLKYHKQGDFHEVLDTTGTTVYIPGVLNGSFEVDGVRFGLEVCLDHNIGYLRKHPDGKEPHIHLIASASVSLDRHNVRVKEGGFVLHADAEPNDTQVVRRQKRVLLKGKMSGNDENPVDTVTVGGDPLKFYVIHLKT